MSAFTPPSLWPRTAIATAAVLSLLFALTPVAWASHTATVDTAEELQAALDAAAEPGGPRRIAVEGELELDEPAVYDGERLLCLHGPGSLVGVDPDEDVLVASGGATCGSRIWRSRVADAGSLWWFPRTSADGCGSCCGT